MYKIVLSIVTLLLLNNLGIAQIKVNPNHTVRIGNFYHTSTQSVPLQITDETYFQCLPSLSGMRIKGHSISSTFVPMLRPQWGNTFYVGASDRPLWRVYSYHVHYNQMWQLSDSSLKENVDTLSEGISQLKLLKPVKYDLKIPTDSTPAFRKTEIENDGKGNMGFMAQEMQKIFPKLVKYNDEDGNYMINYVGLIPFLVKTMQEQQAKIEELETEIELLK